MAALSYNPEIATTREIRIAAAYERAYSVTQSECADWLDIRFADNHGTLARALMERLMIAAAAAQAVRG